MNDRDGYDLGPDRLFPGLADPVLSSASLLNEIASRHPHAIPMAAGRPYDDFFDPAELPGLIGDYQRHLSNELGLDRVEVTRRLFQYGRTAGHIGALVARTLAHDHGITADPDAIVVLTGAQEGMFTVARALCASPRDVLLVTSPCYVGMLGAAKLLGIETAAVPERPDGLAAADVAAVAARIRSAGRRPVALYLVPNFSNPSGHTLTLTQRRELLEVAATHRMLLIEDDPYGFLADSSCRVPALKALDRDRRVVHIGTFAKTCFPGARVGYVVADQRVGLPDGGRGLLADQLALIRSMITVNTSAIAQAVIGGMLLRCGGRLSEANQGRVAHYRRNLTMLLHALEREFPPAVREAYGVSWTQPVAGFFVVLRVPFVVDDDTLRLSATRYGVLWMPMSYFYVGGGPRRELRLSCSALDPEQIDEGVRRVAALVRDCAGNEEDNRDDDATVPADAVHRS
ncbi:PLP-dependent aminotransferase family protein [Micromonospora sp. NPDC007271]|uniref:aminotransferase-like domain-containing protein n=1 Tax=Micromonospora sp. NPDC007271 TaxID=3154587 RepID=UPI0033C5F09E